MNSLAKTSTCWICGEEADTREHKIKVSDLRAHFRAPTQEEPIFLHTSKQSNIKIGSLKAKALKFQHRICQFCNSTRTQPHDFAWQALSHYFLTRRSSIQTGRYIRCNSIFPYNTKAFMLSVHLYFVKLFGCQIVDAGIPIDIHPFSTSILEERPHPHLYLAFGPNPDRSVGGSDVQIETLNGKVAMAMGIHETGSLCVGVMYAIPGERRQGLENAWHPQFGCKRILLTRSLSDEEIVTN